jgi:hypothetical protein
MADDDIIGRWCWLMRTYLLHFSPPRRAMPFGTAKMRIKHLWPNAGHNATPLKPRHTARSRHDTIIPAPADTDASKKMALCALPTAEVNTSVTFIWPCVGFDFRQCVNTTLADAVPNELPKTRVITTSLWRYHWFTTTTSPNGDYRMLYAK